MAARPTSQAPQACAATGACGRREDPSRAPYRHSSPTDRELEAGVRVLELWRGGNGAVTVVAIDGYGASGKSTIAERLCSRTGASLVRTDDFFLPPVRRFKVSEPGEPGRAKAPPAGGTWRRIASFYDLRRLRVEALEPLRAGHEAVFRSFDWDSGVVSGKETRVEPNNLVLLEGVCSGAPELGDLVDRAIYVDTPGPTRLRRLRDRIAPEDWDEEWLRAERRYFSGTRPLESFDLVIRGTVDARLGATRSSRAGRGPARGYIRRRRAQRVTRSGTD